MAQDIHGRRATTRTSAKQPVRGPAPAARDGGGRSTNAWQAAVVFGTAEAKIPVNIRLDADIVRYFRAGGAGYQTRINEVLKASVVARLQAGDVPSASAKSAANGHKRKK